MRKKFDDTVIITWYTQAHLTLREISKLAGMTHTAIWKRLKKHGIKATDGEWAKTLCAFCGSEINRTRGRVKKTNNSFCNVDCYASYLESPGYKPWRHGSRLARAIVGQYYHLEPENIVHHEDGDQKNNEHKNLKVFATNSDHMKYHRSSKKPIPIWDGSLI